MAFNNFIKFLTFEDLEMQHIELRDNNWKPTIDDKWGRL